MFECQHKLVLPCGPWSGKSAPAEADVTSFSRALRANFAQIESEFAVADDPNGDIAAILKADVPAVVAIVDDGGPDNGGAAGTGFVVSANGVWR